MPVEPNTIHQKDCFDLLREIGDGTADLVVLDPNYQDWDDLLARGLFEESIRVLKPTGNILLFTKKPYDLHLRNKIDPFFRNELIWKYKKNGNWYSHRMPIYTYQKIYWCCHADFFYNPQTGIPHDRTLGDERRQDQGDEFIGYGLDEQLFTIDYAYGGQWLKDFLDIPRKRENKTIPTKPTELCQILIRCFSPLDGLVVDPFMGGGNVVFTAMRERRRFIGGDTDEACFKFASEKIAQR